MGVKEVTTPHLLYAATACRHRVLFALDGGWSIPALSTYLGVSRNVLSRLKASTRPEGVSEATAQAILDAYIPAYPPGTRHAEPAASDYDPEPEPGHCSFSGCTAVHDGNDLGLCPTHYARARRLLAIH